jgi:hypothetical protein
LRCAQRSATFRRVDVDRISDVADNASVNLLDREGTFRRARVGS